MTHFKVDIQLPLNYNPEDGNTKGEDIPAEIFLVTYEDLLAIGGGINTTNVPIIGSWIHPESKKRYNDKSVVYTVIISSEDKMTVKNVPKIRELIEYKEKLKERFKQEEIFIVATRCNWL